MNLELLRKSLKKMQDGLAEFETKATADEATAADVEALEKAVSDIEATERKIAILEKAQSTRASFSKPADAKIEDDEDGEDEPVATKSYRQPREILKPEKHFNLVLGGVIKAFVSEGKITTSNVMKSFEPGYAKVLEGMMAKNLNTGTNASGGFTIPTVLSSELIPLLYRRATFKAAGPRLTPMPNGNFLRAGAATGATAAYRGEAAPPAISHATFRNIDMKAKLLAGITSVTDQMLRWSNQDLAAWAANDLETAASLVYDQTCYLGVASATVPGGIFNIAGIPTVTQTFAAPTTPTVYELDSLGRKMEAAQANVNMPYNESKWVMSFRQAQYMADLRLPQSDELAFPTMSGSNPTWRNKPVVVSMQIPTNLGAGTNETFMGLVHFPTVLDGQSLGMSMKMSDTASYKNGGTELHAFSEGLTLIRVEMEHDLEIEYTQTVVKSPNMQIGA